MVDGAVERVLVKEGDSIGDPCIICKALPMVAFKYKWSTSCLTMRSY